MDQTTAEFINFLGMQIPLERMTVTPLNTAAFLYLFACLAYFVAVARSGLKSQTRWTKVGAAFFIAGFVCHTTGLLGRWYVGGINRPPWTNLYESLIGFAWMLSLFNMVALRKWRVPLLGAISAPLVFLLMGMSVMTPNKSVEPLIPALQSYWLKIHVVFGMTSYAGFTLAACFAFLHLVANRASLSKIGAGLSLMLLLNLGISGGLETFKAGTFFMAKTVQRELPDGKKAMVKDTYQDVPGGPIITRMEDVPHANIPFFASIASFIAAFGLLLAQRKKDANGYDLEGFGRLAFGAGLGFMLLLFAVIGIGLKNSATLTLASNPYLTMLLFMSFFIGAVYFVVTFRYQKFLLAIPSADRLEELSYKHILFAFPFQTLLLVTGAIWAYYAWGRSWGWDPKETWAFITWLWFLIYLHGKLLMNWKPNFLSTCAIIGFTILVFAFLGVNLVLSGLHSYGAA